MYTHVKALRLPVPNGEPYENWESGHGANRLGRAPHVSGILRILVSDRVDLSIRGTRVKVFLHEGLDSGIGTSERNIKSTGPIVHSVRGRT